MQTKTFQEELSRYLSAISCGIIQYTRYTNKIIYVNDIALEILGYSSMEDMQSDNFNGVVGTVHPEDIVVINRLVSNLADDNDKVEYEYRVINKDGRERICYGSARLISRDKEEPVIIRSIIDITDRRNQIKRSMESVLQAFQLATEETGDTVFIFDCERQAVLLTSRDATVWGVKTVQEGVPYDTARSGIVVEEYIDEYLRLHEEMMNGALTTKGKVGLKKPDGSAALYELTFRTLMDENGNPTRRAAGVYHDITEESQREIRLKQREEEQALVFNVLAEEYANIYIVNIDDATVEVRKQEGFKSADVYDGCDVKFPFNDIWHHYAFSCIHEDDVEEITRLGSFENLLKELEEKDEFSFNYRSVQHGLRYFQARYVRLDEKRIIAGFRNIDDSMKKEIQQRKLLENALAAAEHSNRAKTTFLNNMSHDIRTPMNAIIGFANLASSNIDDKDSVVDCLKKIQTSSNLLLSLINDVLDMSRIESGKVNINESEVFIPDILHNIRDIVQADVKAKNLEASFEAADVVDNHIWCDRLRLNQVIINCIGNSIKFTPENGSVSFKIIQVPCDTEGYASYKIKIKDSGIGMSREFLQHIFEPFERERSSTVSGIQGTGLGMTITKNIVDMMGGTVAVESEPGVGTEFTFLFTFRKAEVKEQKGEEIPEVSKSDLEGLRILLVEDNELNREIAYFLLEDLGAEIEMAEDGSEAVKIMEEVQADHFDIILMDVQMPVMDGYQATKNIRALADKKKAAIPIIAMTANAFEEDKKLAFDAGMNGHIAKPIEIGVVLNTIHKTLEELKK